MEKWKKRLEVVTNIAILCVCVLIAVIGVKRFLLPNPSVSLSGPAKGTHLSLVGVDWAQANQTLLMVLSTQCHFCSESADFYKTLIPAAEKTRTQVVAFLPQTPDEGREYFQKLGLPPVAFTQGLFTAIKVSGTPTLVLVDKQGKVVRSWAGKLPPQSEAEVIASLR